MGSMGIAFIASARLYTYIAKMREDVSESIGIWISRYHVCTLRDKKVVGL